MEQKFASLQIVKIIEKLGDEKVNQRKIEVLKSYNQPLFFFFSKKQVNLVHESELLTRERLCCGLSIFEFMLSKMKAFLISDPLWSDFSQKAPDNGVMNVDENVEFHRIWSAMQFIYCMPRIGTNYLVE